MTVGAFGPIGIGRNHRVNLHLQTVLAVVKSMYRLALEQIYILPAAELSMLKCTCVADGVVGFVTHLVHEMLPHVSLLVVNVELHNVHEVTSLNLHAC